jgi:predicted dehydrogenase
MPRRLDRADEGRKVSGIKHSLSTAVRQAVSRLETQRHRLGAKTPPPGGRLKCGLFGAGRFFDYAYAPALNQKDSPLAITGLLARDDAKFKAASRGLRHMTSHFTDADALLASGIEAALILLPNDMHFATAKSALERGLHVFCEKPLTNSVNDALALKALAEQSKRVLMVDFNQRYFARNHLLADLIARKHLGKVTTVHAYHNQDLRGLPSYDALHRDRTGGGVIHNAGIHFINLFLHWFGPPERVRAVFENRALPHDCGEDTAHCEFWFHDGTTATLEASLANAVDTTYERVQVLCEDGELTSDLKKGEILCRPGGKPRHEIPCRPEIIVDSVFNALLHFGACVENHSQPETDVDDFIRTLKTVEALTLSARRGTDVTLAEIDNNYV